MLRLSLLAKPLGVLLLLTLPACGQAPSATDSTPASPSASAPPPAVQSFAAQVDALKVSSLLNDPGVQAIIRQAEELAGKPIWVRAYDEEQMKQGRKGPVDGRRYLEMLSKTDSLRKRRPELAVTFGLASSDLNGSIKLLTEAPLMAAVYRLTGSEPVLKRLVAQLEEASTWNPFQRPGWTSAARGDSKLPPGGDGVWLATGTVIQALALTLDILPPDTLPAELHAKLIAAMERELRTIESDWNSKKPWYVQKNKAESNQWIVPASGLVIACAFLGPEKFPEAYAVGVKALEQSLALAGQDGSLSEGYTYGLSWSSSSLLLANRFMLMAGDKRFDANPFFANFPKWAALVYQPGRNVVNCFDGFGSQRNAGVDGIQDQVCRVAAITNNEGLYWVLKHIGGGPSPDVFGLLAASGIEQAATPPPASGLFEKAHLFVWRSSWQQDATGLWVRGGDKNDFHDHWDRGHVNFIARGQMVLIEAGTPGYADKRKKPDYDSLAGHNVLQVGDDTLPTKQPAPIQVLENTPEGGRLTVEAGATYPALSSWTRDVRWTLDTATITDTVQAKDDTAQPLLLRWHLGSAEAAVIEGEGTRVTVTVPAGKLEFPAWIGAWTRSTPKPEGPDIVETPAIRVELTSNVPLRVSQTQRPDHIFKFRRTSNPHTTLEIAPAQDTAHWELTSAFSVPQAPAPSPAAVQAQSQAAGQAQRVE